MEPVKPILNAIGTQKNGDFISRAPFVDDKGNRMVRVATAVNPRKQEIKAAMKAAGFRKFKEYRKWLKNQDKK